MSAKRADYDVIILGAGPVGLALAAGLARERLAVALLEKSALSSFDAPVGAEDWDSRIYAISPGSAEFLRAVGAWQRLPSERLAAIEMMDVRGDGDGAIAFSAYELGERALAWIVENRELSSALVESVRRADGIDVLAPCEPTGLAWRNDAALLTLSGETDGRVTRVAGTVVNGEPRLVRLNDYWIDMAPADVMLITRHQDKPGTMGRIGLMLGDADVNISGMHLARSGPRTDALMVLALDDDVPDPVAGAIRANEAVLDLWVIRLGMER